MNKPPVDPQKDSSSGGVTGQKDYFQVTDELSRENSHFSISEALLTVVEQVQQGFVGNIHDLTIAVFFFVLPLPPHQYKANTTEAKQEAVRGDRDHQATPPPDPLDAAPDSDLYATSPPPRSWGSLSSIATEGRH